MKKGNRFAIAGYDLLAFAQVASGGGPPDQAEVVLLSNNSTHFIVAFRERGAAVATFITSHRYAGDMSLVIHRFADEDDEQFTARQYRIALGHMVQLAKDN